MKSIPFLLLVFSCSIYIANAQNTQDPSIHLQNTYHQTVQYKQSVFTGKEYFRNYGKIIGHPFWGENMFKNGNVGYDGNLYPNLPLKLDLMFEELVTHGINQGIQINIIREKIDSFTIGNTRFWHLTPTRFNMTDGFYEVLHSQKYTVLCKRSKYIKETISQGELEKNVVDKEVFFLKVNDKISEIKNRQILYDLFKDKKNEVLDYVSNLGLNYRKNQEAFIIESVKYFEQLTNQ